jgi:6,7-dimethyl-8-ribityllumazine synthase
MDLSIDIDKPIGFGVLTCETLKQASERSNPNKDNKGAEAAKGCVSLMYYLRYCEDG